MEETIRDMAVRILKKLKASGKCNLDISEMKRNAVVFRREQEREKTPWEKMEELCGPSDDDNIDMNKEIILGGVVDVE